MRLDSRSAFGKTVQVLLLGTPWRLRRVLLCRLFGWSIHPQAHIGFSLVGTRNLEMAAASYIGHANIINNLESLTMNRAAVVAKYNWIRAGKFAGLTVEEAPSFLEMHEDSFFTMMHFIDCSGGITMHRSAGFGGARSVAFGHYVDTTKVQQATLPTTIGENVIIAAHATVVPGSTVAKGIMVAAGSVVVGNLDQPNMLYAGNPAVAKKALPIGFAERAGRDFS